MTFDVERDAFIAPKPFPSWVLDEQEFVWIAPVPIPDDDKQYKWDEETLSWKIFYQQQPYPSWILDEETSRWIPPISKPTDGVYVWNEDNISWTKIEQ